MTTWGAIQHILASLGKIEQRLDKLEERQEQLRQMYAYWAHVAGLKDKFETKKKAPLVAGPDLSDEYEEYDD